MILLQIEASYGLGSTGNIALDIHRETIRNGGVSFVASPLFRNNLKNCSYSYKIGNWFDHKLHALLSRFWGYQAYYSLFPTWKLIQFIKKIKPDIIQFHDLHSNFINLNLLLKYIGTTDIKLVITLHDCWFFTGGCFHYTTVKCNRWQDKCGDCPKRFLDTPAYFGDRSSEILQDRIKFLGSIKDLTIVGVSNWITNEFRKSRIPYSKLVTIHNGVDVNIFTPVTSSFKKEYAIENKYLILGPASKWLHDVNSDLLEYFISEMPLDTVLVLFGCNEIRSDFPENIIQLGFTNNRYRLAELYSAADVFVNCSQEDTLSMINIEAQACGTPVIAYSCTGINETVENTFGCCVPRGNYRKMFDEALRLRLLKHTNENMVKCLTNHVRKFFNGQSYANDYVKLYNELLFL